MVVAVVVEEVVVVVCRRREESRRAARSGISDSGQAQGRGGCHGQARDRTL